VQDFGCWWEVFYHGKGGVSPGKILKFRCRGGKKGDRSSSVTVKEFQALIDKDLAELNRQAKALDLPHIIVPSVKQGP